VPELARLIGEFPTREQLRYLLMLALYRCGRQAAAMAAFQDARVFLTEEFGVEPGEQLRGLQARILRSDPALMPPAPRPPATARSRSRRRPWRRPRRCPVR
jgi:DNA-binding SARP family transcriptional activator